MKKKKEEGSLLSGTIRALHQELLGICDKIYEFWKRDRINN